MKLNYMDKDKQKVKDILLEIACDLENIEEVLIQVKQKDGAFETLCSHDMNSYKLMLHKNNLEQLSIYKMIKENFITPE